MHSCLLYSLCIDIQLIVHRYLHEYNYKAVRKQYTTVFVTSENKYNHLDIYWDNTMEEFVRLEQYFVMNVVADLYPTPVFQCEEYLSNAEYLYLNDFDILNIYTGDTTFTIKRGISCETDKQ